jgi:hypothetical protein
VKHSETKNRPNSLIYNGLERFEKKEVPTAGIEPALANANRILSPACLPVPPQGQLFNDEPKISNH